MFGYFHYYQLRDEKGTFCLRDGPGKCRRLPCRHSPSISGRTLGAGGGKQDASINESIEPLRRLFAMRYDAVFAGGGVWWRGGGSVRRRWVRSEAAACSVPRHYRFPDIAPPQKDRARSGHPIQNLRTRRLLAGDTRAHKHRAFPREGKEKSTTADTTKKNTSDANSIENNKRWLMINRITAAAAAVTAVYPFCTTCYCPATGSR